VVGSFGHQLGGPFEADAAVGCVVFVSDRLDSMLTVWWVGGGGATHLL
jgi:hypothetical protein